MKTFTNILFFLFALLSIQKHCFGQAQTISLAQVLAPTYASKNSSTDSTYSKFQFSVIPFVGTNGKCASPSTVDYSLNLFGGYNKNIRKLEIGGIFNADLGNVQWLQYAGVANVVWKNLSGLQFAGCANVVNGDVNGGQFSGITNIVLGNIEGVQYAGIANINKRKLYGIQVAGILNHTEDSLIGIQIAGISNIQIKHIQGAQIGGISNIATEGIDGLQIAGIVNVSNHQTEGTQVSGLINIADKIIGSQIGVFNFSDSITGVPIGFFSYANSGFHKLELSANELFYLNAAFITGVDAFHNIFTAGIRPDDSGNPLWTVGYGIGTKIKLSKVLALNIDLTSNQISRGEFTPEMNLLNKGYLGVDVKLTKKISITTGPELNAHFTNTNYKKYPTLFSDVKPRVFYQEKSKKDNLDVKMWIGWKFGIRLF